MYKEHTHSGRTFLPSSSALLGGSPPSLRLGALAEVQSASPAPPPPIPAQPTHVLQSACPPDTSWRGSLFPRRGDTPPVPVEGCLRLLHGGPACGARSLNLAPGGPQAAHDQHRAVGVSAEVSVETVLGVQELRSADAHLLVLRACKLPSQEGARIHPHLLSSRSLGISQVKHVSHLALFMEGRDSGREFCCE